MTLTPLLGAGILGCTCDFWDIAPVAEPAGEVAGAGAAGPDN